MRNEKEILKQNSLTSGIIIKLGLRVAVIALCGYLFYLNGISVFGVVGVYILIRSILKIRRLSINVVFSLLSILFLIIIISLILLFIF
ncbi:MAG: hypothetical protein LBV71_00835 [Prevotella sp.]|nr:hypothetical protein [Prevotella sp.]